MPPTALMVRLLWLSFCDPDRPVGEHFLGVALVEVEDEEIADARLEVAQRFPHARPGAEIVLAATRKAHLLGCNPGGEVLSAEMPPDHAAWQAPHHRLLSRTDLVAHGLA
jgi:hypothetical protein